MNTDAIYTCKIKSHQIEDTIYKLNRLGWYVERASPVVGSVNELAIRAIYKGEEATRKLNKDYVDSSNKNI